MTRFLGSGLPKRIETSERYFSFRPEVGRVAEHVEQLLAGLAVEARVVRQLLEHDDEARLLRLTRSVMQSYSASRFLPKCSGKVKASAMLSSTSCFDCELATFAYKKCWPAC